MADPKLNGNRKMDILAMAMRRVFEERMASKSRTAAHRTHTQEPPRKPRRKRAS